MYLATANYGEIVTELLDQINVRGNTLAAEMRVILISFDTPNVFVTRAHVFGSAK